MRMRVGIAALCLLAVIPAGRIRRGRCSRSQLSRAVAYVKARCPQYSGEVDRSEWERGRSFNALYPRRQDRLTQGGSRSRKGQVL